jgi:hypothetical protein
MVSASGDKSYREQCAMWLRFVIVPFNLLAIVIAIWARSVQLSLADPYNNVYTTVSTTLLFLFFITWIIGAVLAIEAWSVARSFERVIVTIWLVSATTLVTKFFVGLLRFLFP